MKIKAESKYSRSFSVAEATSEVFASLFYENIISRNIGKKSRSNTSSQLLKMEKRKENKKR